MVGGTPMFGGQGPSMGLSRFVGQGDPVKTWKTVETRVNPIKSPKK